MNIHPKTIDNWYDISFSMVFGEEAENSSPVLEHLELVYPCRNIERNSTQIYEIPCLEPQSEHDNLSKAGSESQSPGQYEEPNNSIYEYPEELNNSLYEYPEVTDSYHYDYSSAEKSGKFENPEETRNGEKSHIVAMDGIYTPLMRSQGDIDENEAQDYQPLMHGERIEGEKITEEKNKPDELIYVTVLDRDYSHGCEDNGCATAGNVEEGKLGVKN